MQNADRLNELLEFRRQPVAIKFQGTAPDGIPCLERSAVSGCTYWKHAAEGHVFYTEAKDHYGCPIGSHTHGIDLPAETAKELEGLVETMVQLEYISMDEVSEIPRLEGDFGVAIYAPLADAPFQPDVVLLCGNARQMMLVAEAAQAARLVGDHSVLGRPTCAAIPAVVKSGRTATNLGCIGNRVYTEIDDDELYFVVAGSALADLTDKLETIVRANNELKTFHEGRLV